MKEERVRKLAAKALIAFIALMALLTWTAGALTDLTVARISTVTASRGTLERRVDSSGTLYAASSEPLYMDEAIRVAEVYVSVGDTVEAGDILFTLDLSAKEDQLISDSESYEKSLLSYQKSQLTSVTAPSTAVEDAQRALQRAIENKASTVKTQEGNIETAQRALVEAQQDYATAQQNYADKVVEVQKSLQDAVSAAQTALSKAENDLSAAKDAAANDPDDKDAASSVTKLTQSVSDAQQAYSDAQYALYDQAAISKQLESTLKAIDTAAKNIFTKEEALEKAYDTQSDALRTADRSIEDAQITLDAKATAEEVSDKNSSITNRQKALENQSAQIDLAAKERSLEELKALIASGGDVVATVSGRVTAVNVTRGSNTAINQASVEIATGQSVDLKVNIDEDSAELLQVGMDVDVRSASNASFTGVVTEINEVTGDSTKRQIVISLSGDIGQPGETAQLRYRERTAQYDAIVPLSALRSDDAGDFILVAEQVTGSMGSTTTARRVDIAILDSDSSRAAIQGSIGLNDRIITRSDRSISDGDRVLVEE